MRYLIDTSVFIYSWGKEHIYREPCRLLIGWIDDGSLDACISVESLREFIHIQKRRGLPDGILVERSSEIVEMCSILPLELEDFKFALSMLKRGQNLDIADCILAATALNHGIEHVVTPDQDFDRIDEVMRIDPLDLDGIDRLTAH